MDAPCPGIYDEHPCFNPAAVRCYGRIHLPIAPRCNIRCRYCVPHTSCTNESRPGATYRVLDKEQALVALEQALAQQSSLRVVGIAGPGDPLAEYHILVDFLATVREHWPDLLLCLSTNGLHLALALDLLREVGLSHLTVTINAVDPEIASRIIYWVEWKDQVLWGREAGQRLIEAQLAGVAQAVQYGFRVKVNCVLVPGINAHHLEKVASTVRGLGVNLLNVMPLLPRAGLAHIEKPDDIVLAQVRRACAAHLPVMNHCRQCRADAVGLLAEDITLDRYLGKECS